LYESHAIVQYLARKFLKADDPVYPQNDLVTLSKIDQFLHWHHLHTRTFASDLFHAVLEFSYLPFMLQDEVKVTKIDPLALKLNDSLSLLEPILAKQK
jgi:glutathione S-transferase